MPGLSPQPKHFRRPGRQRDHHDFGDQVFATPIALHFPAIIWRSAARAATRKRASSTTRWIRISFAILVISAAAMIPSSAI